MSSSSSSLSQLRTGRRCSRNRRKYHTIAVVAIVLVCYASITTITVVSGFVVPSSSSSLLISSSWTSRSDNNNKNHKFASRKTILKYEKGDSISDSSNNNNEPLLNTWDILSNTEKWLSKSLNVKFSSESDRGSNNASQNDAPSGISSSEKAKNKSHNNNPYSRKEVSFVCEMNTDSTMIVANVFRRLREIREEGERHGQEEDRRNRQGNNDDHTSDMFRQTKVIVIPSNKEMNKSFYIFNNCLNAINEARENSKDYVITNDSSTMTNWDTSVSCAHLHPKFGTKTPQQILRGIIEEEDDEIDIHLQDRNKKINAARQSPYPTIVIEVKSIPLRKKFEEEFVKFLSKIDYPPSKVEEDEGISVSDVQKLEALFGKPAHIKPEATENDDENDNEDRFWDSIGKLGNIEEISARKTKTATPMSMSQNWIQQQNGHDSEKTLSSFTSFFAKHADEAFEFFFINLAMHLGNVELEVGKEKMIAAQRLVEDPQQEQQRKRFYHHYLVMPSFLSNSATSLEKFTSEVQNIIDVLPLDLSSYRRGSAAAKIDVSNFHPEHIDPTKRSPVPMIMLQCRL